MQGFFPDRGVLGRQGRDTDASNGEVLAERQVLGPACGLVFGSKVLSRLETEERCCVSGRGVSWCFVGAGSAFGFACLPFFCLVVLFQAEASRGHARQHAIGAVYNAFTGKKSRLDSDSDSTHLLLSAFTACLHRTAFSITLSHKS